MSNNVLIQVVYNNGDPICKIWLSRVPCVNEFIRHSGHYFICKKILHSTDHKFSAIVFVESTI